MMFALAQNLFAADMLATGKSIEDKTVMKGQRKVNSIKTARYFIHLLEKKNFNKAISGFDKMMKEAMSLNKLKKTWQSVIAYAGEFVKQGKAKKDPGEKYDSVAVTCEFKSKDMNVKVVVSKSGKVSGLFFTPVKQGVFSTPPYAKKDQFREAEVSFGEKKWKLPATLTLPLSKNLKVKNGVSEKALLPPVLILVHGSGPNDRDETIGPNKPFRDIAWGLATMGVAVFRYEKRTKQHGLKIARNLNEFTIKDETVDDALSAVSYLKTRTDIDSRRIYILGHSLGGMVIPKIAKRDATIAGVVIFAGNCRPLEDLLLEQFSYIFNLDGTVSPQEKVYLDNIKKQVELVRSGNFNKNTNKKLLPLGINGCYWLDLRNFDPAKMASFITMPVLVLQGKRDYQVTMTDFNLWKKSLSGNKNASFKAYKSLNHIFIAGEGLCTPDEYSKEGHVQLEVIEDISTWIQSN